MPAYPDFTRPFEVNVDACAIGGGGATLCHRDDQGNQYPWAYLSTVFTPAEKNYATIEQKCLALVKPCKHFQPYLLGRPFTVYSDHAPLQWLSSISDPAGRLIRWALILAEFQMVITHRKGVENGDADGLWRAYYPELKKREDRPDYPELKTRKEGTAVLLAEEGSEHDDDQAPRLEESSLIDYP